MEYLTRQCYMDLHLYMSHNFLSATPPKLTRELNVQELEILEKLLVVLTESYPSKDIRNVARQLLIESNIFESCLQI